MALTCVVKGCSNGSYDLSMWKRRQCQLEEHNKEIHELCRCEPPYKLYPLPTERKNKELRMKWIKMINRTDEKGEFYNPSKYDKTQNS